LKGSAKLRVRLTPSGGADRIDGAARDTQGPYLKARVRPPPEDGKANAALEALLAKALGVAKTKVCVARGATSRMKQVEIEGISEAEIGAFIARLGEA
jgi:uncharacterized protein YggU (UPF0235/DUF167 family)